MESSLKHSHILHRKTCPCFSLNISFSSHDHCQHLWTATSYFTLEPQQLKCVPTSRPFSRGTVSFANSGHITLWKRCLPYIHPYAKSTVAYSGLNAVSSVPSPQNVMVLWGGGFGRHSGLDENRRVKPLWMGLVALKNHERAGFLSLLLAMRMLAICNQEREFSLESDHADILIWKLPVSRTVRNKFMLSTNQHTMLCKRSLN